MNDPRWNNKTAKSMPLRVRKARLLRLPMGEIKGVKAIWPPTPNSRGAVSLMEVMAVITEIRNAIANALQVQEGYNDLDCLTPDKNPWYGLIWRPAIYNAITSWVNPDHPNARTFAQRWSNKANTLETQFLNNSTPDHEALAEIMRQLLLLMGEQDVVGLYQKFLAWQPVHQQSLRDALSEVEHVVIMLQAVVPGAQAQDMEATVRLHFCEVIYQRYPSVGMELTSYLSRLSIMVTTNVGLYKLARSVPVSELINHIRELDTFTTARAEMARSREEKVSELLLSKPQRGSEERSEGRSEGRPWFWKDRGSSRAGGGGTSNSKVEDTQLSEAKKSLKEITNTVKGRSGGWRKPPPEGRRQARYAAINSFFGIMMQEVGGEFDNHEEDFSQLCDEVAQYDSEEDDTCVEVLALGAGERATNNCWNCQKADHRASDCPAGLQPNSAMARRLQKRGEANDTGWRAYQERVKAYLARDQQKNT